MKSTTKRALSLILMGILAAGTFACGGEAQNGGETTVPNGDETSSADTEPAYKYPELDLKGDTFTILNTAQTYGFYSDLDFDEATGDTLNDAIYDRNRLLEEKFKFKFEINEEYTLDQAAKALETTVLAGDSTYDVAFIRDYYLNTALTEGYLADIDGIPEIQLDKPWWDGAATENARVGKSKKALFASTDVSLVDFEGTIVWFFNEDMLEKLKLDTPYQLVLDGKWTFDKMTEYMKAGANLNGDEKFVPFNVDGKAVYGLTGFQHTYNSLISSAGVEYIDLDKDGNLFFSADNEKFYNTAIKISQTFSQDGDYLFANGTTKADKSDHYEGIFKAGRALLLSAQLKAANFYRDMDATYGIVPVPKWDESQENYSNLRTFSYLMVIPVTNKRQHETGIIMDAMSYITYDKVMPIFYNGRISQKILRNDESIEMMNIIRSSRHYDLGTIYGVYNDFSNKISDLINQKSTDFSSMVASFKPTIEKNLESLMAAMDK